MKPHTALRINAVLLVLLLWPGVQLAASDSEIRRLSYPQSVLETAGITSEDVIRYQAKFKTNPVHREWVQHIDALLPDLDARKKTAIIQIHTSFLTIKNALDQAYSKNKINQNAFTNQVGVLFNWFEQAHTSVLSPAQYDALFGDALVAEEQFEPVDSNYDPLGFPIENPQTTVEMIQARFTAPTIAAVQALHQQRQREIDTLRRAQAEGSMALPEFENLTQEINAAYVYDCRNILSDEQFELLFGGSVN